MLGKIGQFTTALVFLGLVSESAFAVRCVEGDTPPQAGITRSPEAALASTGKALAGPLPGERRGPRTRILPDFLIGGHALEEADT